LDAVPVALEDTRYVVGVLIWALRLVPLADVVSLDVALLRFVGAGLLMRLLMWLLMGLLIRLLRDGRRADRRALRLVVQLSAA
jgi:hypothetical protein